MGRVLTVFSEQVVGPPNNKLGNKTTQLFEFLLTLSLSSVGSVGIATPDNCVLKVLPEVFPCAEIVGVSEVQQ